MSGLCDCGHYEREHERIDLGLLKQTICQPDDVRVALEVFKHPTWVRPSCCAGIRGIQ